MTCLQALADKAASGAEDDVSSARCACKAFWIVSSQIALIVIILLAPRSSGEWIQKSWTMCASHIHAILSRISCGPSE